MYDAKQFWQMVKSVSDKPYNSVDISIDGWFSHFTDVFSTFDSVEDSEFDDNFNSNVDLENDTDYNIFNGDITDDDIINAVKDLNPFPHTTFLQQTTLNIFCQKIENLYKFNG